jgi:hypothetical protein
MEALRSMDIHELAAIEQAIFVEKDESIVSALVPGDRVHDAMYTRGDLQRLSKTISAEATKPCLHSFKTEYPVIFAALHAKFGLMPSNSRIAEQVHGGLRDSLKEGVPYAFTDAQRSLLVNIEYHYREARRKLVRERYSRKEDAESGGIKKHNTAYSGVKHDRLKAD